MKRIYGICIIISLFLLFGTQLAAATIYIPENTSVGTWNPATRTYTLTTDVVGNDIEVSEDNLTLDGDGFTVTGTGTGYGVLLSGRTDVTIKDLNVHGFRYGIGLAQSSKCTLASNTVLNSFFGIILGGSSDNTLIGNSASDNEWAGIGIGGSSNDNILIDNDASSNHRFGVTIGWYASNNILRSNTTNSNTHTGISMSYSSDNILISNSASSNPIGIALYGSSSNNLTGNIASNNAMYGIYFFISSDNTLENNITSSNQLGIMLYYSSNGNALIGNVASSNSPWHGFALSDCSDNTLTGNTASNNAYGISLWQSSNNQIYNNNFIDNTTQAFVEGGSGNIFDLEKPIGGNYWSDWTTPDADGDGFVDLPYVIIPDDVKDNLPWTRQDGWMNPADAIEELIDLIEATDLQQGIESSLVAKLEAAMALLERGQQAAAINILNSFINEVEDQRGEKLTDAQADLFVSCANRIINRIMSELDATAAPAKQDRVNPEGKASAAWGKIKSR